MARPGTSPARATSAQPPRPAPPETTRRTLLFSLAVCFVCSLVVSSASVLLGPIHRAHLVRAQQARILEMLRRQPGLARLLGGIGPEALETRIVDLTTAEEVTDVDPAAYDFRAAAKDPRRSVPIPRARDIAGIERRARRAPVYVVRHEGRLRSLILPVHGRGYGGLIYGYLALEGDANTIAGIGFYEHSETPGIGGEIDAAEWRDLWRGKRLFDEEGTLRIRVVDEDAPDEGDRAHRVDAIGGATRTSEGVERMIRFWLGDDGFGPYLRRLRR